MPDTKEIHELFNGEDDFAYLTEGMDNDKSMQKLVSSVEGVGKEVREELDYEVTDIDDISLGWMRIAWEGHHRAARLEGRAFADTLGEV